MNKLSKELRIPFYVANEDLEHFYEKIKGMTPVDFEKMLRNQYIEAKEDIYKTAPYMYDKAPLNETMGPSIIPNHQGPVIATPLM